MKKLFLCIFVLCSTVFVEQTYAQMGTVVLLKGRILNESTPTRVEIVFKDQLGQSVRARSAADGSYQAILKPGQRYAIVMTDDNLTQYTFRYEVPEYNSYTELVQDFPIGAIPDPVDNSATIKNVKKKKSSKKSKKGR